jgi:hypothetical protein
LFAVISVDKEEVDISKVPEQAGEYFFKGTCFLADICQAQDAEVVGGGGGCFGATFDGCDLTVRISHGEVGGADAQGGSQFKHYGRTEVFCQAE